MSIFSLSWWPSDAAHFQNGINNPAPVTSLRCPATLLKWEVHWLTQGVRIWPPQNHGKAVFRLTGTNRDFPVPRSLTKPSHISPWVPVQKWLLCLWFWRAAADDSIPYWGRSLKSFPGCSLFWLICIFAKKKKIIKNIATNKWLFCEGCRSCINSSLKQQSSPLMNEMPFRRMRNLVLSPQLSPDVGSPLPPTLRFRAGKDLVWLAAACVFLHCAKSRIRKTWGGLQTSWRKWSLKTRVWALHPTGASGSPKTWILCVIGYKKGRLRLPLELPRRLAILLWLNCSSRRGNCQVQYLFLIQNINTFPMSTSILEKTD